MPAPITQRQQPLLAMAAKQSKDSTSHAVANGVSHTAVVKEPLQTNGGPPRAAKTSLGASGAGVQVSRLLTLKAFCAGTSLSGM